MNWKRLLKKYILKDIGNLLFAGGLCTLGPWGISMGILWMIQDAIGKRKSFDTEDMIGFLRENPAVWNSMRKIAGEELVKHFQQKGYFNGRSNR